MSGFAFRAGNPMHPSTTLILGGARSGKSGFAETRARQGGLSRFYLATGEAGDDEMRLRIDRHRADRDTGEGGWTTLEVPLALEAAISAHSTGDRVLLVDCLTLWLSNIMMVGGDIAACQEGLVRAIEAAPGPVLLVSNEVGLGLVPETPLGRDFRDAQGRLNQGIAACVPNVIFVAAGLPLVLKGAV
jgi:adenosylcobinamide kinase / adenosylcobinamide-phosphate guanylyltransferase